MTDNDAAAARARGQALRSERLARARSIRRRVISAAVALFVAAWMMIAVVLVSGHDPALAKKTANASSTNPISSTPTVTTSSSGSTGSSSSSAQTSGSTSVSSGTSSGSGSSGSGVSSVTTSQS